MGINPLDFIKETLPPELPEVVSSRLYTINGFLTSATRDLEVKYNLPDPVQQIEYSPNKISTTPTKPAEVTYSSAKPDASRVANGVITAAAHQEQNEADRLAQARYIIDQEAL